MQTVVKAWQPLIQQEIASIISDFSSQHSRFAFDTHQLEYIQKISQQGKQFRGCLLAGFYQLLQPELSASEKKVIARVAAAVELSGTAILFHDDIIDRSESRRGMQTVHTKMTDVATENDLKDTTQFGIGAAICLGDVLFFLADKTIAELDLSAELRIRLAAINGEELALLGLAEIEDMRLSSSNDNFTKQDILTMFAGKTGRYTGRWPLHLACVLADVPSNIAGTILQVGEDIGMLYQLKDDELGVFGNEIETGKSTTSDLTEGKKTLYYLYLQQQLSKIEKEEVFSIIGNSFASDFDLEKIKKIIETNGIKAQVENDILALKNSIDLSIKNVDISISAQKFLSNVTEFVISRNK